MSKKMNWIDKFVYNKGNKHHFKRGWIGIDIADFQTALLRRVRKMKFETVDSIPSGMVIRSNVEKLIKGE